MHLPGPLLSPSSEKIKKNPPQIKILIFQKIKLSFPPEKNLIKLFETFQPPKKLNKKPEKKLDA